MNKEQLMGDLLDLLRSARIFAGCCCEYTQNIKYYSALAQTTKDNEEAKEYLDLVVKYTGLLETAKMQLKNLEWIDEIRKESVKDYLLVINYLYDDQMTQGDLLDFAGLSTRQGLIKRIKTWVYFAWTITR